MRPMIIINENSSYEKFSRLPAAGTPAGMKTESVARHMERDVEYSVMWFILI